MALRGVLQQQADAAAVSAPVAAQPSGTEHCFKPLLPGFMSRDLALALDGVSYLPAVILYNAKSCYAPIVAHISQLQSRVDWVPHA